MVLLIADISGYTGFMLKHRKALSHSRQIISELLQTIIDQAKEPLSLVKLEGDAAFMYATKPTDDLESFRAELGDRVQSIFAGYARVLEHLTQENICRCAACSGLGDLRLKVIVHSGEALFTDHGVLDLHGVDPIVIHRLTKNGVDAREYLLLSESARSDVALPEGLALEKQVEVYDDIGPIDVWVARSEALAESLSCTVRSFEPSTLPWDILRGEIQEEYGDIVLDPHRDFHFHTGREELEICEYVAEDIDAAPESAVDAFLGTGNPFAVAPMPSGGKVVDVGSGAGMDLSIASRQVGPTGRVIGVDMTSGMVAASRDSFAGERWSNIEIREGFAEELPIDDGWADVVISNGVFNLCPDKVVVLEEFFRVLRPGGVLQIADIAVPRPLRRDQRLDIDLWKG
jgi:2-polyprenyl-3-methyl-5-hydroxy-6-metoxy-1,4-benzoquinol methylase